MGAEQDILPVRRDHGISEPRPGGHRAVVEEILVARQHSLILAGGPHEHDVVIGPAVVRTDVSDGSRIRGPCGIGLVALIGGQALQLSARDGDGPDIELTIPEPGQGDGGAVG